RALSVTHMIRVHSGNWKSSSSTAKCLLPDRSHAEDLVAAHRAPGVAVLIPVADVPMLVAAGPVAVPLDRPALSIPVVAMPGAPVIGRLRSLAAATEPPQGFLHSRRPAGRPCGHESPFQVGQDRVERNRALPDLQQKVLEMLIESVPKGAVI